MKRDLRALGLALLLLQGFISKQALGTTDSGVTDDLIERNLLLGRKLKEFVSCGAVDKIAWKSREDSRSTRLLVRDMLRINSETKPSSWEVSQVLDTAGYVTFVFRRMIDQNKVEAIVVKDAVYNQIISNKMGKVIKKRRDLKNFINRPAIVFEHADGSTISYLPGSAGNSALQIQLAQSGGRLLPPLFLRNATCLRPDLEDSDGGAQGKATQAATPKAAGGGLAK